MADTCYTLCVALLLLPVGGRGVLSRPPVSESLLFVLTLGYWHFRLLCSSFKWHGCMGKYIHRPLYPQAHLSQVNVICKVSGKRQYQKTRRSAHLPNNAPTLGPYSRSTSLITMDAPLPAPEGVLASVRSLTVPQIRPRSPQ